MKEIINPILFFLSVLFSVIFYNLCYFKINNYKIKLNFYNFLIVILMSFLIFINNSYNNLWIKFLLTTLLFCCSFKILSKDSWKKVIIS